jgi:hypothetical protein
MVVKSTSLPKPLSGCVLVDVKEENGPFALKYTSKNQPRVRRSRCISLLHRPKPRAAPLRDEDSATMKIDKDDGKLVLQVA